MCPNFHVFRFWLRQKKPSRKHAAQISGELARYTLNFLQLQWILRSTEIKNNARQDAALKSSALHFEPLVFRNTTSDVRASRRGTSNDRFWTINDTQDGSDQFESWETSPAIHTKGGRPVFDVSPTGAGNSFHQGYPMNAYFCRCKQIETDLCSSRNRQMRMNPSH